MRYHPDLLPMMVPAVWTHQKGLGPRAASIALGLIALYIGPGPINRH